MGHPEEITFSLPANVKYASVLGAALTAMLEDVTNEAFNIQLSVHELFTNIVEHGYGCDANQQVACHLLLDLDQGCFTAVLTDTARPFSPESIGWEQPALHWETAVTPQGRHHTLKNVPEPDLLQERGRGFFLISQLMNSLVCHTTEAGNKWMVSKAW